MSEYYLSAERLEELKQELQELKTTKRAEIADRLKKAKELGDLSENSEYFEAREVQGHVETRIAELEHMIKNAKLIQKSERKDVVGLGSTIVVQKDGTEMRFTIVGSNETNPAEGKISNESPLGSAFIGKKSGALVNVKTPGGETTYKIVSIE